MEFDVELFFLLEEGLGSSLFFWFLIFLWYLWLDVLYKECFLESKILFFGILEEYGRVLGLDDGVVEVVAFNVRLVNIFRVWEL